MLETILSSKVLAEKLLKLLAHKTSFLKIKFHYLATLQKNVVAVAGAVYADKNHIKVSDEYVIKIRCLETPLSHFAQAGHPTHTKISDEYVIKKR